MKKAIYALPVLLVMGALVYFFLPLASQGKPRVVALVHLSETDALSGVGFREGMAAAGWHEGKQVVYLANGPAGSADRLEAVISDYLRHKPDLILVSSTPATRAVQKLTAGTGIPVVFAPVNDPVSAGLVADLKQPGRNITGVRLSTGGDDLRLKWLKEVAPNARKVWVPYTPEDKSAATTLESISAIAPKLGIELIKQPLQGKAEIDAALAALPADVDAIFMPRDIRIEAEIRTFVDFANARRLPLCGPGFAQVTAGALMSYGFMHQLIGRQASKLAVQIFQGQSPAGLPVETAENLLSINLVTAKRIGLAIPDNILRQAEKIIRE